MDEKSKDPTESVTDGSKKLIGKECFFSEAAFLRVMGPGPSLQERLHAIASRPRTQEVKNKISLNIDRSIFESLPNLMAVAKEGKMCESSEDDTFEADDAVDISMKGEQEKDMSDSQMICGEKGKDSSVEDGSCPQTPEMSVLEASSHFETNSGISNSNKSQDEVISSKFAVDNEQEKTPQNISNEEETSERSKVYQARDFGDNRNNETNENLNNSNSMNATIDLKQDKESSKDILDSSTAISETRASNEPGSSSSLKDDDDDVCCLVMPNLSDDDSGGENKNEAEESFYLVMPGISSDEMSSKEDVEDFYKKHPLNRGQAASFVKPPTDPASQFKSPTIPPIASPEPAPLHVGKKQVDTLQKDITQPLTSLARVPDSSSKPLNNSREDIPPIASPEPSPLPIGKKQVGTLQKDITDIPPIASPEPSPLPIGKKQVDTLQKDITDIPPIASPEPSPLPIGKKQVDTLQKDITDIPPIASPEPSPLPIGKKQVDTLQKDITQPVTSLARVPDSSSKPQNNSRADMLHVGNIDKSFNKDNEQLPKKGQVTSSEGPSTQKGGNKNKDTGKVYQNVRSKLSKKQHKRYIQLYKRHVCPMMKGTRKTAYSDAELKELVELEELQQHVSEEQVEYQEYLKHKALRNPNAYNYLTNTSRVYAQSRYNSYHRPRNYIKNYEINGLFQVPLVLEDKSESCFMTFQKTLLKLGNSPRITIPDVRDGNNPIPIKVEPSAINAWFPSSNKNYAVRKTNSMDHKMISEDDNAMRLAEEEGIDIVLSSSSFKCILDNHGSDVMRAWDIPVTIRPNPYGVSGCNTVYLDKPLYRDDFLIRELNALYHKYALRTCVSRPRDKGITRIQANRSNSSHSKMASRLENRLSTDDLDIFSTGEVNDIETFGSFSSTSTPRPSFDKYSNNSSFRPDPVKVSARCKVESSPMSINISNNPTTNTTTDESQSPSLENPLSSSKCLRRSTRLSTSLETTAGTNSPLSPTERYESAPPSKLAKLDSGMSKTSQESPNSEHKRKRGSPRKDQPVVGNHSLVDLPMKIESPSCPPVSNNQVQEEIMPLSPDREDTASCRDKTFPSLLDSILGPSDNRPQSSNWQQPVNNPPDIDNPDNFLPVTEKCNHVIYNRWEMGPMKLLIRCNYHGAIKDKGKPRYVYLSPKMEYQPDCGMEQVTLNEMTRTWASCFIRPGTSLIRARINAFTSELLMVEEKPIDGILNPSLPFKPEHSFAVLRQIFEKLSRLPEGQYLLSHLKGDKFCKIRKFNGKASLMPAPKKKKTGKAKEGQVPWIPIDPTILTPSHIHNSRIPATFMPSDWSMSKNHQGGGNRQQNQGQKNRREENKNNRGQWKPQNQNN